MPKSATSYPRGAAHPKAKLTAEQAAEIRAFMAQRKKWKSGLAKVARSYGVSVSTLQKIGQGRSWRG